MVGWVLALSALVALSYSKAIITNNCRKDIYIWSVPEKSDLANNLSISPGKRYEEPWRSGTSVHPGIAIKVSTEQDGIYTGKSEINLQYDVDASDSTKIWIDLATIRGNYFDTATLNTCHGAHKSANVHTEQCSSTDDIELVLCGSARTVPSRDSTPIRFISNCIGLLAERDDPLRPRMCSGRVVGPKRMPMVPDEHKDDCPADPIATVPLKTVMRREAAKHASSQDAEAHNAPCDQNTVAGAPEKATEKSTSSRPLCNILYEAWPDAQCDEKMAQHNAKLFYRDNCGDKTKNMFPGASCEAIRHQMKQIYPDVDDNRLCIYPYLEPLQRFWGTKDNVWDVLNHQDDITEPFLQGKSWTSDDEVCRNPNKKIRHIVKVSGRRCVKPFCDKEGRLGGDCNDVENVLQRISNDAGFDIDWTTDDDACAYKRVATEKRDVNTTAATQHSLNPQVVCIIPAYNTLSRFPYWRSKQDIKNFLQQGGPYHLYDEVIWTSDEEQCQRPNNVLPIETPWKRPCVKPYCHHDCSEVEDAFNDVYRYAGFYGVDWTTDDDADFDPLAYCSRQKHSALALRQDVNVSVGTDHRWNDIRKVCITTANEKLGKYWGANETEARVPKIFPKVFWTEELDDCSPQAIAESRAYHHKLIDKKQRKEKKCVVGCHGKTCKRVKKELNKLSQDVGENWSWTDDEKVCASNITFGPEGPKVDRCIMGENAINKLWEYWGNARGEVMDDVFPGIIWTDDECNLLPYDIAAKKWFNDRRIKGKRIQRCVTPYCKPFNADCSDVEDQLEEVSKNLGRPFDWTTDDDACPKNAVYPANHVLVNRGEPYSPEYCILAFCQLFGYSTEECAGDLDLFEDVLFEQSGARIKLTVNGLACHGPRVNDLPHFPPSLQAKRRSHKVCRKDVCRRSNQSDHDCQKVEHKIRSFLNETMQIDVDFADSPEICDPALAYTSLEELTTFASNSSTAHQDATIFKRDNGSQQKPWYDFQLCDPRISKVDCDILKRVFYREDFPVEGFHQLGAVCHTSLARGPVYYAFKPYNDSDTTPTVCAWDLCIAYSDGRDHRNFKCGFLLQDLRDRVKELGGRFRTEESCMEMGWCG
ncbi:hypothetical protein PMIN07_001456 [Paraphaeosphaeria minitans]